MEKHKHNWKQWGIRKLYKTTFWGHEKFMGIVGAIYICETCLEKKEVPV